MAAFDPGAPGCIRPGRDTYEFEEIAKRSELGREINVSSELDELVSRLEGLAPDGAKALWAGIAFAQWLGHREDEVRLNRWLDAAYLQSFAT